MKQTLKMVDLHGQYLRIKDEIDAAIGRVLDSTAFINGPQVKEFARAFAHYNGIDHVVPCGNGTDALQIALMTLDLQPGDEVILPVHTYVATAEVIALLKLQPVFVDVDPATFNIDINRLEERLTKRTKAIVPVHLYGQCADMEPLLALARQHQLWVIEDSAQATGASYTFSDGTTKKAGTMGHIGCTSFFPSKNLGCYGDGGAMLMADEMLATKARMIANHGQSKKYHHDLIGCNSRLDTLQAAILATKLPHLDDYNRARQQVAQRYNEAFAGTGQLITPAVIPQSTHVYHQYTVRVQDIDRDRLQESLAAAGIPTMIYYPVPLHLQQAYKSYGYRTGDFPVAEELSKTVLSLPVHTELTTDQQDYIIEHVLRFIHE
ncbi:MAG TPA: DegT/DnrJ/EryC1/StrS family aminotransferase [Flammeovirgaceae bacterium]|nr:DegT/DnrJ/EryC1/StrS family aminotransferase [Flammeovirgaceae bacterium]